MMTGPKRVLILYYSLTGQTEKVLNLIRDQLQSAGHSVDMRRIQPVTDWKLPLNQRKFFSNWAKVWVGMNLTQPLEPMDFGKGDYDYVILGFQPWNLAPSIPMNSFLDSPMSEILRGKKVIGVVTCRQRWERSFRITKAKVERRGGMMIDGFVIVNYEKEPANMITTVNYLFYGGPASPDHWVAKYFRPYGISQESLSVASDYGRELAVRMVEDRVGDQRGWRIVDKPLQLV